MSLQPPPPPPHVSLVDAAGPSTEHNSAVLCTPVEPSTSNEHDLAGGCLNSHGVNHNDEVTFDLSLEAFKCKKMKRLYLIIAGVLAVK